MTDSPTPALLLDRRQTAEALAVSVATLDRLTRNGDLPCVRIGRSVRFPVDALQEWIDAHKQTPSGGSDGAT